jgi:hypothetical protein
MPANRCSFSLGWHQQSICRDVSSGSSPSVVMSAVADRHCAKKVLCGISSAWLARQVRKLEKLAHTQRTILDNLRQVIWASYTRRFLGLRAWRRHGHRSRLVRTRPTMTFAGTPLARLRQFVELIGESPRVNVARSTSAGTAVIAV